MKKILTTLAVCLVLVALMAMPVMAAGPKTLTFDTGLKCDDTTITGNLADGFTIVCDGSNDSLLEIELDNPVATPALKDGMYAFSLKAQGPQKAILKSYFAAKLGWTPEMYRQINAQIAGGLPFFYLKADNNTYTLVDGFVYGLSGDDTVTLRINDDYPVGTYVYKGHLKGENNALLQVTVTLTVVRS